jgi:hypothetical protein
MKEGVHGRKKTEVGRSMEGLLHIPIRMQKRRREIKRNKKSQLKISSSSIGGK